MMMVNDNMPAMLSKTYGSGLSTSAEKALLQHHVPASAVLNKCFKFNPATPLNYSSPSLDRVLNKRLITYCSLSKSTEKTLLQD
jgi:hypothetical protein